MQLGAMHYVQGSLYDRLGAQGAMYDKLEFFETEKEFWTPAQTADDLYSQFSLNRYREIPRKDIM